MVTARLSLPDVKEKGWLLDGYPRSYAQAQSLEERKIRPDIYIVLDVCRPLHIHDLFFFIASVLYSTLFVQRICSLQIGRIRPLVRRTNFLYLPVGTFWQRIKSKIPSFPSNVQIVYEYGSWQVLCSWISSAGQNPSLVPREEWPFTNSELVTIYCWLQCFELINAVPIRIFVAMWWAMSMIIEQAKYYILIVFLRPSINQELAVCLLSLFYNQMEITKILLYACLITVKFQIFHVCEKSQISSQRLVASSVLILCLVSLP